MISVGVVGQILLNGRPKRANWGGDAHVCMGMGMGMGMGMIVAELSQN